MQLKNFALIAFVVFFSNCQSKKIEFTSTVSKPPVLTVEGYIVAPQVFENNYVTSGSLLPNEEIQILPEISGRITDISFNEGASVRKGQVLIKLYNEDIRAQIQKLHAQRELQDKIKQRQKELLGIGGISQQDYETTIAQIQSIDADIAFSQAQLTKTVISAPFDGRIGIRNVSLGAVINTSTVIASLQQTSILKMDFTIPDQYKDEIKPNKKVTFTVTGSLDTFTGVVRATESSADAVTRTIKVRTIVKNDGHNLVPGSFTHVYIPFENNKSALLIPSQALIPTDRDKEVAVLKNGKVKLLSVLTGARTTDKVEIIKGLEVGDTIITTGIMQIKPNMSVIVKVTGR